MASKRSQQWSAVIGGVDQPRMRPLRACDRLAVVWSREQVGDGLQGFTIEGMAVALDLNTTFGSTN
jgi:hypothetical protein